MKIYILSQRRIATDRASAYSSIGMVSNFFDEWILYLTMLILSALCCFWSFTTTCFVLSQDCTGPVDFSDRVMHAALSSAFLLHGMLALCGLAFLDTSKSRMYLASMFLFDTAVGSAYAFLSLHLSYGITVLGHPGYHHRAIIAISSAAALSNDGYLVVRLRLRRVVAMSIALVLMVVSGFLAQYIGSPLYIPFGLGVLLSAILVFGEMFRFQMDPYLAPWLDFDLGGGTPSSRRSGDPAVYLVDPTSSILGNEESNASPSEQAEKGPPPSCCSRVNVPAAVLILVYVAGINYYIDILVGPDIGDILVFCTDILVVILRYMTSAAILHSDLYLVAKQAAQAQVYKREAADTRLNTIQQFTRYIFHEARVPLQAVSLAVSELEASLTRIKALSSVRHSRGRRTSGTSGSKADTVASGELRQEVREALDVLRSQQEGCKGLQCIFDDVLEAQRIEQGRLKLRDEVVDVPQVLDDIVATFQRTADSRGIALDVAIGDDVPGHIRGDPVRIKQVVANLVSNALKFTPVGGCVRIRARLEVVEPAAAAKDGSSGAVSSDTQSPGAEGRAGMKTSTTAASVARSAGARSARQSSSSSAGGSQASKSAKVVPSDLFSSIRKQPAHDNGGVEVTVVADGYAPSGKVEPSSLDSDSGILLGGSLARDEKGRIKAPTNARIVIAVSDTGCGISEADLHELFSPYKQTRHGVEYAGSSSGLGLYISRGIARQMGGDLGACSEGEGKGSTFSFELGPLRLCDDSASPAATSGSQKESTTQFSSLGNGRLLLTSIGKLEMGSYGSCLDSVDGESSNGRSTNGESLLHSEEGEVNDGRGRAGSSASRSYRFVVQSGDNGPYAAYKRRVVSSKRSKAARQAEQSSRGGSKSSWGDGTYGSDMAPQPSLGLHAASHTTSSHRASQASTTDASMAAAQDSLKAWCLVVDDVPTNRKLLARGLRRMGYQVYQAAHGKEAVEACRKRCAGESPVRGVAAGVQVATATAGEDDGHGYSSIGWLGLIIMDKSMPVMDGVEATRAIRAKFGSQFMIVGLTGDALGEDLEAFKAVGLNGVLGKPASAGDVHKLASSLAQ